MMKFGRIGVAAVLVGAAALAAGVGPVAVADEQAGGWSEPQVVGRNLVSLSCVSSSFCVAVTNEGDALTYDGSGWSKPITVDSGATLNSVSCPTEVFCVAVAKEGTAYTYNGSRWSEAESIDTPANILYAVSCSSTKFCMAGDLYGHVLRFNGNRWTAPVLLANDNITSIACSSRHFCMALFFSTKTYRFDGTAWTLVGFTGDDAKDVSVSCASSHFCASAGRETSIYDGRTWGQTTRLERLKGGLSAVSCPSRSFCALLDLSGHAYLFDGKAWGPRTRIIDEYAEASVSCPTREFCAAVTNRTLAKAAYYRS